MSSVPTTVDVERGTPLEGLSLTREQQLELYRSGVRSLSSAPSAVAGRPAGAAAAHALCCCAQFVVLKNVVSKELTAAAKAHMAADVAGEFGANATGRTCAIRLCLLRLFSNSEQTSASQPLTAARHRQKTPSGRSPRSWT